MSHRDPSGSHVHHRIHPSSPSIPIDPSLSLSYPSFYPNYPQPPQLPQNIGMPPHYSSPSSQGSEVADSTPTYGKRPLSSQSNDDGTKRPRKGNEEQQSSVAEKEGAKPKSIRGSRACTVCRRLKMKCQGAESGGPCKRCRSGNHECIFEESNRGKRSTKKHELLSRSLKLMEKRLDTVLRSIGNPAITSGMVSRSPSPAQCVQAATTSALLGESPSPLPDSPTFRNHSASSPKLHSLPDNSLNPLGLLAEASLANRRSQAHASPLTGCTRSDQSEDKPNIGVASDNYFKPGPMTILPLRRLYIERQVQPEMLSFVSTEEVVALFDIYFNHVAVHCSLLDSSFHTPSLVCSRSPFLLTTICSIASRYYTIKTGLHSRLTDLAKKLAFSVPAVGYKSVEIVQAYLLLSLWGLGAVERYEHDKTWLLLGMAIRMATDLNLHRKTAVTSLDTQEGKTRDLEVHNRERTWLLCYCLDRSLSAQMGKPHTIKEDAIIRGAVKWSQSPSAVRTDPSIAAYCELQRITSRALDFLYSSLDTSSGLQKHIDYMIVIKTFEGQVDCWRETWLMSQATEQYKRHIGGFYYHYTMLVLNAFGLQNALDRSPVDLAHFFGRCYSSATACALLVRDQLGPSGHIKYSPDSHFVLTSYALLSLLKLVRPEFRQHVNDQRKILFLVRDCTDTLEKIAINPQHTPALYSSFIRALVNAKMEALQSEENNINVTQSSGTGGGGGGMVQGHQSREAVAAPPYQPQPQPPPSGYGQQLSSYGTFEPAPSFLFGGLSPFDNGEMGPVADMSTFPPTMAPLPTSEEIVGVGSLTMDHILTSGFWDSVLVPGYNNDGLSGGYLFGAGGGGLITSEASPAISRVDTPGAVGIGVGGIANGQMKMDAHALSYEGGMQLKRERIKVDC